FELFSAGGPGGQHQNMTASAVRAVHKSTGLTVVARDGRSQHRNKAIALKRLGTLLKVDGELAAVADDQRVRSGHRRLERGRPIRTFEGKDFRPQRETKPEHARSGSWALNWARSAQGRSRMQERAR